jgi:hypothetical protein
MGDTGRAHTQRVLDVDQPAVKTKKLSDPDQLISHCLVGALVPSQEGFTEPPTIVPLCYESPCKTGDKVSTGVTHLRPSFQ